MGAGNGFDKKFFVATASYQESLDNLGNTLLQVYVQVKKNKQGKWTISLYELTKVIENEIGMNKFTRLGDDNFERIIYFFDDRMPQNDWLVRSNLVGTERVYIHNTYMTLEESYERCEDYFSKEIIKTLSKRLTNLSIIKTNKSL